MRQTNPFSICLTGCGIITSVIGFLTMSTFTPMASINYNSGFTRYEISTQQVKCVDSTNRGNFYEIPLPRITQERPPSSNQTAIPTLYLIDNGFVRSPYYELYVTATTKTDPVPREIRYTMRYKFMNQCVELGENLVRNFIWNATKGYVYEQDGNTYPLAYPAYDIVIPYASGASVIVLGIIFFICACCAGTPGCPVYNWVGEQQLQTRGPSLWRTAY